MGKFLTVPDDALAQAMGIIARTGGGKSFTARGLVEPVLARGARVCIIDPTGVWWGLRLKPDGKTPSGMPIVILGGDHGDLPITPEAGAAAARMVIEHRTSFVVDVSEFGVGERDRFAEAFFDTLYRDWPRGPLTLVIDEADAFAPQKPMPEQRRMASRLEQIVRRGRVRGFRPWLITQRPAVINKDVLGMVGTMICLQLTLPHDRDAIERWIGGHADPKAGRALLDSLPKLAVGEGWVWSPRAGVLERGQFPMIQTFDSMRAPDDDEAEVVLPALSAAEIERLGAEFQALVAKTRPKASWSAARVAELIVDEKAIRAEEFQRGYEAGAVAGEANERDRWLAWLDQAPQIVVGAALVAPAPSRPPVATPIKMAAGSHLDAPAYGLGKGERAILTALAQRPAGLDRVQLALLAGYAHNGGGFRNYLGALKSTGLIVQDGAIYRITDAGWEAIGPVPPLPTGRALLEHWCARFGKGERSILHALARRPGGATIETVAAETGYEAGGGGFRNYVGRLRTLELVRGDRNGLQLAPELLGD